MSTVPADLVLRTLAPADWPAVERIYAEGIATRMATFETATPSWEEWDAAHLVAPRLVALLDGGMAGWAALSPVSRRAVYRGVAEVSVYVADSARRRGVGRALLEALIERADAAGLWTLQATIFAENGPSIRLHEEAGFRLVGRRERIAQLDGRWRDTVLYERRAR
ncbi:MAG TPA: GNAT family N-acetyltransferase [Gemmatimonadales bacterium]|nr:GNAT family N-acetyltransferase [Gemmatimonadales bacterium]